MEKFKNNYLEQLTSNVSTSQGEVVSQIDIRAEGEKSEGGSKFGKFKDAQSLFQAYNNLQSDYTKKCQSLSETLKQIEEIKQNKELISVLNENPTNEVDVSKNQITNDSNKTNIQTEENVVSEQIESSKQLKQNLTASQNWQQKVKEFFNIYPNASEYSNEIALLIANNKEIASSKNPLDSAWSEYTKQNFISGKNLIEDETFLQNYVYNNQKIKDKILSNYFSSINIEPSPNLIANQKGSSVVLTNTNKPKSIRETGKLVEDMFS